MLRIELLASMKHTHDASSFRMEIDVSGAACSCVLKAKDIAHSHAFFRSNRLGGDKMSREACLLPEGERCGRCRKVPRALMWIERKQLMVWSSFVLA
eukprot:1668037-Amphidinium_carterae.1